MRRLIAMPRQRGVTLIEVMITITILAILMSLGLPSFRTAVGNARMVAATEFYLEAFRLARSEALKRNSVTRVAFSLNGNGHFDAQTDICYPALNAPCDESAGKWSTPTAAGDNDPAGDAGTKSKISSASHLAPTSNIAISITPATGNATYFLPTGWLAQRGPTTIRRLDLEASAELAGSTFAPDIHPVSIVISLAGVPYKCNPQVDAGDSRACP